MSLLFFCVVSSCRDDDPSSGRELRNTIRRTWLSTAGTRGARHRFFVGRVARGGGCAEAIARENADHGNDVVILHDLVDSYANLTRKSMGMFTWVEEQLPPRPAPPAFVAKVDDDVYVDVDALITRLRRVPPHVARRGLYMGFINPRGSSPVVRDPTNKWHDPDYPMRYYPPYAAGPFYVLSRHLVSWLARNRRALHLGWTNEDASVGTWLLSTKAYLQHDPGVLPYLSMPRRDSSELLSSRSVAPFVDFGRTFGPVAVHLQSDWARLGARRNAAQRRAKYRALELVHEHLAIHGLAYLSCCSDRRGADPIYPILAKPPAITDLRWLEDLLSYLRVNGKRQVDAFGAAIGIG